MIRAGTLGDVDRLREIARAAYAPYVPLIGFEPPPLLQDFAEDVSVAAVWVAGDPVLGYVVARPKGDDWLLENVAVAPEAQGTGTGKALIAFAEAEGARQGFERVVLYTNAKMTANLGMYPALGYTKTDQRTEHGLDRVFFQKTLGGADA